jgi:hypothetical protein
VRGDPPMATMRTLDAASVMGTHYPVQSGGPVFVVGVFRSGTSFFFSLLNKHPEIALLYEADIACFHPKLLGGRLKKDWFERVDFWNSSMLRHGISQPADLPVRPSPTEGAVWLYKNYADSKGARIYGEKSPSYADCLEKLVTGFPNSRIIILWRNPIDVCDSVCRAGKTSRFFRKRGMVSRILHHFELLQRDCDRLLAQGWPILQIDYESLVHHREETMRSVCEFLDLEFDASMLSSANRDLSMVPDGVHHQQVRRGEKPVTTDRDRTLSERTRRKIGRYQTRWAGKYSSLLLSRCFTDCQPEPPGFLELCVDRLVGWVLQAWDTVVRLIYYLLPVSWLRVYRKRLVKVSGKLAEGHS